MTDQVNQVMRFTFDGLPIRGQWVRLTSVMTEVSRNRSYPRPVQTFLATHLAAVSMLADSLKFRGAVALQSKGSGALIRSLAECREQHKLRAIAHLREEQVPGLGDDLRDWLQDGQLAFTLIHPEELKQPPYQAFVELDAEDIASNLEAYFARSEQLPTRLFFACGPDGEPDQITGMLLQRLPERPGASEMQSQSHEDAWQTALTLADTLREPELATLPAAELLRRLFAEFDCRVHPARELVYACTCSREKSDRTLRLLPREELQDLLAEQGNVDVDCEFCGARYRYDAFAIAELDTHNTPPMH